MILIVDNYDSFTYNLVHLFHTEEVVVCRNDAPELAELAAKAAGIILSPGPGAPAEAGQCEALIRHYYREKPILGICLGHQAIGEVFGAKIIQAPEILHGKQSTVHYEANGLFRDVKGPLTVMRYHSLIVEEATLSSELRVNARYGDLIMAMQHKKYPLYGVQFHPESIGTATGQIMINAFLQKVEESYVINS